MSPTCCDCCDSDPHCIGSMAPDVKCKCKSCTSDSRSSSSSCVCCCWPTSTSMWLGHRVRGHCAVLATCLIYFAMGLYFSSGNTAIYLTSYLRTRAGSQAELSDSIWFLATVGLSAVLLPIGGWLDSLFGVRACCLLGAFLQSSGILATYFALDTTFSIVVICYGGGFMLCFGVMYTPVLANVNRWFPKRKGLVTGIVAAAMAAAPTVWTPLITAFVNPNNVQADSQGYFHDDNVLDRTRVSLLWQGFMTLSLFLVGIVLLFPAPLAGDPINQAKSKIYAKNNKNKKCKANNSKLANKVSNNLNISVTTGQKNCETGPDTRPSSGLDWEAVEGLRPSEVIRTKEFALLSFKIMLTELVFFYLLFVYKPFGQTFIMNDFYLSAIGAFAALSNTVCRLIVGHLKDLTTYKICSIPLSGVAALLVLSLPFTSHFHRIVYGVWIVASVGIVGSQYALMPSAVTEAFGDRYASTNIGLVYASTVIADILGAVGSQLLTHSFGWAGIISIVGGCALLDFIATFFLPSDPKAKLRERLLAQSSRGSARLGGVSSVGSTAAILPVIPEEDSADQRSTSGHSGSDGNDTRRNSTSEGYTTSSNTSSVTCNMIPGHGITNPSFASDQEDNLTDPTSGGPKQNPCFCENGSMRSISSSSSSSTPHPQSSSPVSSSHSSPTPTTSNLLADQEVQEIQNMELYIHSSSTSSSSPTSTSSSSSPSSAGPSPDLHPPPLVYGSDSPAKEEFRTSPEQHLHSDQQAAAFWLNPSIILESTKL